MIEKNAFLLFFILPPDCISLEPMEILWIGLDRNWEEAFFFLTDRLYKKCSP